MKKFFLGLVCVSIFLVPKVKAQVNIQELYDFGRGHFTTTLEMFQGDKWGNTYFFVDVYHPFSASKPMGYYSEITRALNFWGDTPLRDFSIELQWNGGQFANNAWLAGVQYCFHDSDFSNSLTLMLMYKNIRSNKHAISSDFPMQITAVWGCNNIFGVKGLSFAGFFDIWWENFYGTPTHFDDVVFLAEPQLWYNVGQHFNCPNLSVGGEVELAYNFAGGRFSGSEFTKNDGFTMAPCLGLKLVL